MAPYTRALFIFRRDLRLHDNTGLLQALTKSEAVIPLFCLDPRQLKNNEYRSDNAVQFMIQSLKELHEELKKKGASLIIEEKPAHEVLMKYKPDAVFVNMDYTPFSQRRDAQIAKVCKDHNIDFVQSHDYCLLPPGSILKDNGTPYTIFTPFYKRSQSISVNSPKANKHDNYLVPKHRGTEQILKKVRYHNPDILVKGGRKEGLTLLSRATKLDEYKKHRDNLYEDKTSHLSAHHKFGTISIRESYESLKKSDNEALVRQLYWRDFFTHIAYHFPHVFGQAFHKKYNALKWSASNKNFSAWCEGNTGFPIVDAGMRELNTTGYMHNRARMIVASFLTKDLHINWQWGEKYFAQHLVDYDPCVNNGSWQWAASTGCDAQPYFRIFNPWLQQKKFDPHCKYIKKWVPELSDLDPLEIHKLDRDRPENLNYPQPLVDHKQASAQAKAMYKHV